MMAHSRRRAFSLLSTLALTTGSAQAAEPPRPLAPAHTSRRSTQPLALPEGSIASWTDVVDASLLNPESIAKAAHNTHGLAFPGLDHITDDTAAMLARYPGDVALDSLTSLTPRVAWMLATPEQSGLMRVLSLNGLTELEKSTAEAFAAHEGGLSLDGMVQMDISIARLVCKTRGLLSLRGMVGLTPDVAECIAIRGSLTVVPEAASLHPDVREVLAENPLVRFSAPSHSTAPLTDLK
jgi:hypothetical protein